MRHPSGGDDIPSLSAWIKKFDLSKQVEFFGAGDRGRTDTVSLPQDFESSASANSTTPANLTQIIIAHKYYLCKYFLKFFTEITYSFLNIFDFF